MKKNNFKIIKLDKSKSLFNYEKKVIISEYLKASEFFLESSKVKYLNAILDKIAISLKKV